MSSKFLIIVVSLVIVLTQVTGCVAPSTPGSAAAPPAPAAPAPTSPSAQSSQADKGQVVFYGWSGQWEIWFDECIQEFTKETGIKVKYLSGDLEVLTARIQSEAGNPQADLFISDRGDGYRLTGMGLLDPVDWSKVPNAAKVKKSFLADSFGAWSFDLAVIAYNEK